MTDGEYGWYRGSGRGRELLARAARGRVALSPTSPPTAGEAYALSSALLDLFVASGLDGDDRPTADGILIESLVDGLARYRDDDAEEDEAPR
ncbi:hypothetical protein [Kitasatospora sp. NPDC094015]|uniref:hypothetical protein n=1 Tax=Kitasatospora sp. NPDC094015 TaxID=3155205 RepID=UPI0033316B43